MICAGVDDLCNGRCGDGIKATSEQCDDGANNGKYGDCCDANCRFVTSTTVCRNAADNCDGNFN
jgi:hypothetical protein